MSSIVASPAVGRLTRVGAAFFALWGVLHASVGLSGVFDAVQSGPTAILTVFGGPDTPDQAGPLTALASGIALDFSMVLAIVGGLAVWLAIMIWRGQRMGFWLATIVLGAVDGAFVVAMVLPGYVTWMGVNALVGPALYLLGVGFTAAGLFGGRVHEAAPLPRASQVRA
jgi:hypothetical protein